MSELKPMDIYSSDISIPFQVAAYCRGHKFSVEAVNLARAIKTRDSARSLVLNAEKALDGAEARVRACIQQVEQNLNIKSA
jgi:hypothetical protein